ncbi:MAG: O-methyltransferase [Lachnospiraceae bacterium]|nr:O-methyltransferase [Lachnospiraceae bacterium]
MESSRTADFIKGYIPNKDEILKRLREKAEKDSVPVIRQETEAFLLSVMALLQPLRILELGTATGYSAISMALRASRYTGPEDGFVIDTVEDWPPRIKEAEENIRKAGLSQRIHLIEGDALEVIKGMKVPYDLIFIDAAKGQYPDYLKEAVRLTRKGSVILADNVLLDGEIMESKYIVERRDRTIHKRMREFLRQTSVDERFTTSILPVGDGVAFCVRT